MPRARSAKNNNSTANLGFEVKFWLAADKLRSNMDAVEYKHCAEVIVRTVYRICATILRRRR
jgi:hypothetical protein